MIGRLLESYWTQQLAGSFSSEKHISDRSNQKMPTDVLLTEILKKRETSHPTVTSQLGEANNSK